MADEEKPAAEGEGDEPDEAAGDQAGESNAAPTHAPHPFGLPYPNHEVITIDIDALPEKPWTKPGADMTDYFNYGFDVYWRTLE